MQKIVINRCFGGFGLSDKACEMYNDRKGFPADMVTPYDIPRDDADLVAIVEELGEKASNRLSALKVVEIPDDVQWTVEEYDGLEHVAEVHRTWY